MPLDSIAYFSMSSMVVSAPSDRPMTKVRFGVGK